MKSQRWACNFGFRVSKRFISSISPDSVQHIHACIHIVVHCNRNSNVSRCLRSHMQNLSCFPRQGAWRKSRLMRKLPTKKRDTTLGKWFMVSSQQSAVPCSLDCDQPIESRQYVSVLSRTLQVRFDGWHKPWRAIPSSLFSCLEKNRHDWFRIRRPVYYWQAWSLCTWQGWSLALTYVPFDSCIYFTAARLVLGLKHQNPSFPVSWYASVVNMLSSFHPAFFGHKLYSVRVSKQ